MRKSLQAILFIKAFALGTMAPVFVLLLTSHGATVQTASLFKGIAAFVIIAAEFPSGVFADLFGRKRSFLVSLLLQAGAITLLLVSRSAAVLTGVMVLYGLSRAFASGSVEALAIDTVTDQDQLVRVTSRLNMLEAGGLSAGALLGGVLAGIGTVYTANILLNLCAVAVLLMLTLLTVRESAHIQARSREHRPRLKTHLRDSFAFVLKSRVIRMLLVLCFLTGFAMPTVETYWQPTLKAFTASTWVFGVVSCAGFACVIIGSKLAEWAFARRPKAGIAIFLFSKALMGVVLALFFAAKLQWSFILVYGMWYVFLGGNGVAEQTLLNREAPAAQRASILSLFSFALQFGAVFSALVCYVVSARMDYRATWLIAACILFAATAAYAMLSRRSAKKAIVKPIAQPE